MIELLPLAETATLPLGQLPDPAPADTLRVLADGALSIGFVLAAARIGRRAVMGYFLPDDLSGFDAQACSDPPDPRAIALLTGLYAIGVAATTAGVYLLTATAWAVLWFGAWAFVGAVVVMLTHRGQTPIDDVRLLAEARRKE